MCSIKNGYINLCPYLVLSDKGTKEKFLRKLSRMECYIPSFDHNNHHMTGYSRTNGSPLIKYFGWSISLLAHRIKKYSGKE